jgi:hypothetical protein
MQNNSQSPVEDSNNLKNHILKEIKNEDDVERLFTFLKDHLNIKEGRYHKRHNLEKLTKYLEEPNTNQQFVKSLLDKYLLCLLDHYCDSMLTDKIAPVFLPLICKYAISSKDHDALRKISIALNNSNINNSYIKNIIDEVKKQYPAYEAELENIHADKRAYKRRQNKWNIKQQSQTAEDYSKPSTEVLAAQAQIKKTQARIEKVEAAINTLKVQLPIEATLELKKPLNWVLHYQAKEGAIEKETII